MSTQSALISTFDPRYAGEFIAESYYHELVRNFRNRFSDQITSVTIAKSALESILIDDNVSGIKFMNALEDPYDPSTRFLVLIPANHTVNDRLPNSIIKKSGYLKSDGTFISLKRTWEVLFNHVLNYKRLDPEIHYTRINRGNFFGRERIKELLNATDSESFIYHFGYAIEADLPFKPIVQPSNGFKMFLEECCPCPGSPLCKGSEVCALTYLSEKFSGGKESAQLGVLRSFRDKLLNDKISGLEVEKYYTISASLLEAINNHENKEDIFKNLYDKYLRPSVEYLNGNDEQSAYLLFTEVLEYLTEEYLFQ